MRKLDEMEQVDSCLNCANVDEYVFVLLARDECAPVAIRAWIAERIRTGKNEPGDAQIIEAEYNAAAMENQYRVYIKSTKERGWWFERGRWSK
jgi:hypothetical protein